MLPFLKPKRITTVMMNVKKPGDAPQMDTEQDEGAQNPELVSSMEDFLKAADAKDAKAMAEAFEAAHYICNSYGDEDSENGDK